MDRDSFIPICVAAIVFALGLGLFLYPYIQGFVVDSHIQYDAEAFLDRVDQIQPSVRIPEETVPVEPSIPEMQLPPETRPYADLWDDMTRYNEQIYRDGQKDLDSEYAYQQPSFSLMDYGLDNEIFGVISIPALELEMPIYLGATYSHLNDGAAHMSQTSLPIGGANTNCVIAGHRGWGGGSYFRYVDQLTCGDRIYIINLWETLAYEVVAIKIIAPYQVEEIYIQDGRELLTLLTCHPYASGGKQRYLIICERTEYESENQKND